MSLVSPLGALIAFSSTFHGAPEHYTLSAKNCLFAVVVRKDPGTVLSGAAHDHAIHATAFEGSITWDSDKPGDGKIEIKVPVSGLRADDPKVRKRVSLSDDAASDKDRREIEKHMKDEDQLDAAKFSEIRFESTSCSTGQGDSVKVKGELTVHGTKKAVDVDMKYHADKGVLRARGEFTAKHEDFGMKPYSAALGAVKNADELTFVIDAKAESKAQAKAQGAH
jgi:polyisoprenoid-binding protein YceI